MVHELRARVLFVCLEGFELQAPRRLPGGADERRPQRDACGGLKPPAERPPPPPPHRGEGRVFARRAARGRTAPAPPGERWGEGLGGAAAAPPIPVPVAQ